MPDDWQERLPSIRRLDRRNPNPSASPNSSLLATFTTSAFRFLQDRRTLAVFENIHQGAQAAGQPAIPADLRSPEADWRFSGSRYVSISIPFLHPQSNHQ